MALRGSRSPTSAFGTEEADANQGQRVAKIVEQYKAATGQEQQDKVRLEPEQAVNEYFAVRQERRELEVARLEARLKKIRESVAKRRFPQGVIQ